MAALAISNGCASVMFGRCSPLCIHLILLKFNLLMTQHLVIHD
jgi:hypothetical protein